MTAQPVFEAHFPADRPLTWEDLQGIPDQHYWAYQIIEGQLIVTPSPGAAHQSCVGSLYVLLRQARPADLVVKVAPFDYVPAPGYALQPDVLVARRADVGPQRLERTPLLVIEVLSPSSRSMDGTLKRSVYEQHGVPHYWIVDPDEPSVRALTLREGVYVEVGFVSGAQQWIASEPFEIRVVPADLLSE